MFLTVIKFIIKSKEFMLIPIYHHITSHIFNIMVINLDNLIPNKEKKQNKQKSKSEKDI